MNFHHTQNTCLLVRLISCLADMRSISVQRQVFLFSRLCSILSRPDLDHILIVVFQGCRGFNVFISFPIPHFPWIATFFICSVFSYDMAFTPTWSFCVRTARRPETITPFFSTDPGGGENRHNISFNRLVETSFPLSYGGIHNSAVKTVAKLIWESFAIQAFHQVSLGAAPLALVPSVYALRADGKKNKAYWPFEGALAIPSYICAGT